MNEEFLVFLRAMWKMFYMWGWTILLLGLVLWFDERRHSHTVGQKPSRQKPS